MNRRRELGAFLRARRATTPVPPDSHFPRHPAGRALYPWHFEHSERPNAIAFLFVDPRARDFFVDWREWADQGVFFLRSALARDPGNPTLHTMVEELQARSEEMRARTRSSKYFGKGRMLRAYPKLRHGEKHRSLDELRERLKYERRH